MEILKIGICDDDISFMKLFEQQLELIIQKKYNFVHINIYCFDNSCEFLNASNENSFDIVFLDIEMPQKNGFEIATDLNLLHPNTSIVFVSSHDCYMGGSYEYTPLWFIRKETYNL